MILQYQHQFAQGRMELCQRLEHVLCSQVQQLAIKRLFHDLERQPGRQFLHGSQKRAVVILPALRGGKNPEAVQRP